MKKDLKKWLKECEKTLRLLHLKKIKVLTSDYEKLVIDTQIKDINIIIKKIREILERSEI